MNARPRSDEKGAPLTVALLQKEAARFAQTESLHAEPALFGATDGKAVGTYFEHKFQAYLGVRYEYRKGSSATGIDFPDLEVDVKVTSIRQPQSSCPFKSAQQKIFGLGYSLLVFVYDKSDDASTRTGTLSVVHTVYIDKSRTGDYQTTTGLRRILENDGNEDDLVAFLEERHLPIDDIQARHMARKLLKAPPEIGYLTISNALQWRLQYGRVIEKAGSVRGIVRVR